MPSLSTLTNPTGLIEIDRQRIAIALDDRPGHLAFSLNRLDLEGLGLAPPLEVVVVARRGKAQKRMVLGNALDWSRALHDIRDLGVEGILRFRLLLVRPGNAQLVAAAESLRPQGDGTAEGFIGMEIADDLREVPWEICVLEQEGRAVVRINRAAYPSVAEAGASPWFGALVLPEAVRQLARWFAENPAVADQREWDGFKAWLALHGMDDDLPEDDGDRDAWCRSVVQAFCTRWGFASQLRIHREREEAEA